MAGFFSYLSQEVTTKLDSMTAVYQANLSSDISALFSAAASLYVLWAGYAIMAGKISSPVTELVWRCAGMMIIMIFADYSSGYLGLVSDAVEGIKGGFSGGDTVWDSLDKLWLFSQDLSTQILAQDASTFPLGGWLAAVMVWIGTALMLATSGVVFLVSEVSIRLLLATGPLFIFCLMWGFLRTMFNNWLQAIFANILTILFASMVLDVALLFEGEMLNQIQTQANKSNLLTMGAMGLVTGLMASALILIAAGMAKQLAGSGVEGVVASAPSALKRFFGPDKPQPKKQDPKQSPYSSKSGSMQGESQSGSKSGMSIEEKNAARLKNKRGY
jgi:type IV secretion system protein VirB6